MRALEEVVDLVAAGVDADDGERVLSADADDGQRTVHADEIEQFLFVGALVAQPRCDR